MDFNTKLNNYADLIVKHGLNVQKGQAVNIATEMCHRELALLVAKACYLVGAKFVNIDYVDPQLTRTRILNSSEEDLSFLPGYFSKKYDEFVDTAAANLRIVGQENPEILSDLEPKRLNQTRKAQYLAMQKYYQEGIEKSRVQWTIAAAATTGWAKRLFPKLDAESAKNELWEHIFKIARVDRADYLQAWKNHNEALHKRAEWLNSLGISSIHFFGPGTDLTVGLSSHAIFKGGGDIGPHGVEFEPNIPTEECFTTPDYRKTNGIVRATRPFLVNGKLIEGLNMSFKDGQLIDFSAKSGAETFREYIDSDPGGRRLGEVALVGIDSPVYQSGVVFEEILYDENAACHIAVGLSYKFCLKDGANLSSEMLEQLGANNSTVHTDIMISSEEVDVKVETFSGKSIEIIKKGRWLAS
jgi:aminopeptidase